MTQRARALCAPLRFRGFRALWLSGLLSETGDWAARLALAFLVHDTTGSAATTGAVLSLSFVAWLGPGQLLATLGDRYDRRTVMRVADVVRGLAFGVLALGLPLGWVVAVVLVAGLATPPFDAARAAVTPQLVPREELPAASLLSGTSEEVSVLAGTLVGGAVVALVGAPAALALNGASFLLSAWLLRHVPSGLGRHAQEERRLRRAARAVVGTPPVLRAILLVAVAMGPATAGATLLTPYVVEELQRGAGTVSLLAAVSGITCIAVTALLVPRSADPAVQLRTCAVVVLTGSALVVVLALRPGLPWLLVPVAGLGLLAVVMSPASALVAPLLPDEVRASAFGVLTGALCASQALTTSGAGLLAGPLGAGAALAVCSVPGLVLAVWCLARPLEARPTAVDAAPRALVAA